MNDFQKSQANKILSMYSNVDEIEKGGEGSRGGHVIGHTRSGKPVYAFKHPKDYNDFTKDDHSDASDFHDMRAEKWSKTGNHGTAKHFEDLSETHREYAMDLEMKEKK